MRKVLSKISILTFFLFFVSFLFFPSHSLAQIAPTSVPAKNTVVPSTNPDVPNNLHNWTQTVMIEVMSSLTCQIAGVDPVNPKQSCLGADQKTGKIGFLNNPSTGEGGAIGFMGNMISTLYTPPLHTADYFKDLAQNFGITKKTYAAPAGGTGFQSLSPLINIWSAFRNIVYLFLVIIFVVIGLAIMLRVKIDPRTVMTIQNQIPKIIVGILAVTFSFAIAGFLIDMMWVFIYLIYGIISGIKDVDIQLLNPAAIQGQNAIGIASHITSGGIFGITHNAANSVKDVVQDLLGIEGTWKEIFNPFTGITNFFDPAKSGNFLNWAIDAISYGAGFFTFKNYEDVLLKTAEIGSSAVGWIPFGIGDGLKNAALAILGTSGTVVSTGIAYSTFVGTESLLRIGLPYVIAYIIIVIAVLVALFKLWFALLMSYVEILLAIVLAPFWIIGGIVPGSPISLGGWFRTIGANLLAFPATLAMFMLGKVFMDIFKNPSSTGQGFVPPLIGDPSADTIGSLIGLGIILMTPNIVTLLKQAIKAPKTETGLGAIIGVGTGVPTSGLKTAGGVYAASKYDPLTGLAWEDDKGPKGRLGRIFTRFVR